MQGALTAGRVSNLTNPKNKTNGFPKPGERAAYIYDGKESGFGLRLNATQTAIFILNYRNREGKSKQYKIGPYPRWSADAARAEAKRLNAEIDGGADPQQEKVNAKKIKVAEDAAEKKAALTLVDLAKDYMTNHAEVHKRPHTVYDDRGMLRSVILPKLGTMPLTEITQQHIESLHNSLRATPYRANRVRALLSSIFNRAIKPLGWLTVNPVLGVPKYFGGKEPLREVWLAKEQVGALKEALEKYSAQDSADAIRLLLLTGARPGETLSAQWQAFDLKKGTWLKPNCATKQKKNEHVPLNPIALGLLKDMHARKGGSLYLFPGYANRLGQSRTSLKWAWMAVSKTAGLATEIKVQGKRKKLLPRWKPQFRLYDLRHTFASSGVSNGESLYSVGKLLGHSRPQTTERYAHLQDAALRKTSENAAANIGW